MSEESLDQRVALTTVGAIVSALLIATVIYAIRYVTVTVPSGESAPPAATAPGERAFSLGTIGLSGDAGRIVLSGTVPDEATKERLLKPARVLWGRDHVVDNLTVKPGAAPLWWRARPVDVLARLRQLGSFDLRTNGDSLQLKGVAPSEAIRGATANGATIWFVDQASAHVDLSVDNSGGGTAAPSDALLNERIEFATNESVLPEAAKARLTEIASLLKDDDRVIVITGHTDNQGTDDVNQPLSLARAESVRTFLVSQGVPAAHLQAMGAGASQPVADNATEEGRQRNRRIAFAVAQ